MSEQRSWREQPNGLIHAVLVDPFRCAHPFCSTLHVKELRTECGIELEVVHDEHDSPTCVACLIANDLDAWGEQLQIHTPIGAHV